ncbi:MAG: hypothetical protein QOJ39_121 [Candidatus Eremiobacteraeota bacterium]|jgi:hypothetical protein|nr:hypothetical protein [Candidatus Eremiobacteraeota bacterium]MEA2718257.1 hypothetical protein [Candidatus Eremiobacteraeota bacterium]
MATVTDLSTRRRGDDVLSSISFVLRGVHYGTFSVAMPYTRGKPLVLYVVPQGADVPADRLAGPLDCLVTDDAALADVDVAR